MEGGSIYQQLSIELKNSTGSDRTRWAKQIVESNADLKQLSQLLYVDKRTALRFSWLLSDIGEANKQRLFAVLPYLFETRHETNALKFEQQFVKYWRICGVPEEHKGEAIDLMFKWLIDPKTDTHIKTVSLSVLYDLTKEYTELKNELRLCIEEQKEDMPVSLKKASNKIIQAL